MDLVARHDEDLMLSLRYAVPKDRPRLTALFALQIELRRIPSLVSEPPLGEIRLQWWREALAEIAADGRPGAHPVVELLTATKALEGPSAELAARIVDARARLLYGPAFSIIADFQSFIRDAEAPMARLASGEIPAADAVSALGEAYALARFAPAPSATNAAVEAALGLYQTHAPALAGVPAEVLGRVAFLSLVRGYAAHAGGRPWPVTKRLAMFKAMLTGRL